MLTDYLKYKTTHYRGIGPLNGSVVRDELIEERGTIGFGAWEKEGELQIGHVAKRVGEMVWELEGVTDLERHLRHYQLGIGGSARKTNN